MLIYDGGSEGGSRGGFWSGARKAFEFAAIGRVKAGHTTIEAFYLDRDELPENDSDSKSYGVNFEYSWNEDNTLGATYTTWKANQLRESRDGMDLIDLRAYLTPFPSLKALSFEFEYAKEDNGDLIDSDAWKRRSPGSSMAPGSRRSPIAMRCSRATPQHQSQRSLRWTLWTGFYDWGTWWQGEIAGEYFASNSNLVTNQLRGIPSRANPSAPVSSCWDFKLENLGSGLESLPRTLPPNSTGTPTGRSTIYFTVSFVAAFAQRRRSAVEQAFDRTDDFWYGMVYVGYSY